MYHRPPSSKGRDYVLAKLCWRLLATVSCLGRDLSAINRLGDLA